MIDLRLALAECRFGFPTGKGRVSPPDRRSYWLVPADRAAEWPEDTQFDVDGTMLSVIRNEPVPQYRTAHGQEAPPMAYIWLSLDRRLAQ